MKKYVERHILVDLATRPWIAWARILSTRVREALVGLAIILVVLIYTTQMTKRPWLYSSLFLLWVGPILIALPFLLLFIIPNALIGDFMIPIGCGRNKKTGELDCV